MFQQTQSQDGEEKPEYLTPDDFNLEEGQAYLFSTWMNQKNGFDRSTFVRVVESVEDNRVEFEAGCLLFPGESMNVLTRRDDDALCFCPFEERGTYYVEGIVESPVEPGTTVRLTTEQSTVTAKLFYRNSAGTWVARAEDGDGPWFKYDRSEGEAFWGYSDKPQLVGACFSYNVEEEILNVPEGADAERRQTETEQRANFVRQNRGQEVDTVVHNGYAFTVVRDNVVDGIDFSASQETLEDAIHGNRTKRKSSSQVWFAWDPETDELYGTYAYDNGQLKPSVDVEDLIETLTEQALARGLTLKSDPFEN
jgi:hypothetical protein